MAQAQPGRVARDPAPHLARNASRLESYPPEVISVACQKGRRRQPVDNSVDNEIQALDDTGETIE